MESLFQPGWFGRYWTLLMLHDRAFLIAVTVVIILVFFIMRGPRR